MKEILLPSGQNGKWNTQPIADTMEWAMAELNKIAGMPESAFNNVRPPEEIPFAEMVKRKLLNIK